MKVEESLNVTFDETPPPPKTLPLEDDELVEEEATQISKTKPIGNDLEDTSLENNQIKQTALAISTTEVEYVSTGKACQQALWMKQALVDYGVRELVDIVKKTLELVLEEWSRAKRIRTRFRIHLGSTSRTLSLANEITDLRSIFCQEEYSEEESFGLLWWKLETIHEQKLKADYRFGSGYKIEEKDSFELKGQFLKELRSNTFSGLDHEDANEHIEKVLEIVDLFHIPNITIDQVMLRAFHMSLTGAASRWLRNKPTGSITTWEDLKAKFLSKYCPPARTTKKMEEINNFQQEPDENLYQAWERFKELLMKCPQHYLMEMQEVVLFYNGLDVPTRQILDSRGAIPSKTVVDAKTSDGLAAIQAQLNNLRREIKKVNEKVYAAQVGCEQWKGPHYTKDCSLKEEGKTLEEAYYTQFEGEYRATAPNKEKDLRGVSTLLLALVYNVCFDNSLVDLGANVSVMPLSTYLNLGLGELTHTKLTIELADMIVKYPKGIAENITLRVEEERIIFKGVKPASSLIKRVYMLSLRERMGLDLEARLMGETLVIESIIRPFEWMIYIELNNLNEPFELRRNQGDDLMPTIEEGEVIEEFRTRDDKLDTGIDDYPSTDNAKNHKKTVKTGQTWTREWKSTQRAGSFVTKKVRVVLSQAPRVRSFLIKAPKVRVVSFSRNQGAFDLLSHHRGCVWLNITATGAFGFVVSCLKGALGFGSAAV
ncbi:reverse transcriptase domain-containing protein [Tanacetum coccineum]